MAELCELCHRNCDTVLSFGQISEVVKDEISFDPLAILTLTFDFEEKNYIKSLNRNSKACPSCSDDLKLLAVLRKQYTDLKEKILQKLQTNEGQDLKGRRGKSKTFANEESEESDNEENKNSTISIVNVDEGFKLEEYVKPNLSEVYPKCSLSRLSSDSKVKCLSKKCQLELSFQVKDKQLVIVSKNEPQHEDKEDPNRVIFELTKAEFQEECICEYCCKRFSKEDDLIQHQKVVSETVYKCPLCSIESKSFHGRNLHFLISHSSDRPYNCQNCQKTFKTKYKKTQHEKSCASNTRHPCQRCSKTFSSIRNLNDHEKFVHNKDVNSFQFQCEICNKRFYKKCNYESHLISHQPTTTKYQCAHSECGQTFKRIRTLKSHVELKHSGLKKAFLCSICGHCLESYTGYRQHLAKHSGTVYIKRSYNCSDCDKAFRSPSDLKIHQVVHSKAKAFTCDICQAVFTQKASLKDHYNVHLKKFVCHFCSKPFGRERYLNNHLKGCSSRNKDDSTTENPAQPSTLILINDDQPALPQVSFMVSNNQGDINHED